MKKVPVLLKGLHVVIIMDISTFWPTGRLVPTVSVILLRERGAGTERDELLVFRDLEVHSEFARIE